MSDLSQSVIHVQIPIAIEIRKTPAGFEAILKDRVAFPAEGDVDLWVRDAAANGQTSEEAARKLAQGIEEGIRNKRNVAEGGTIVRIAAR